MLNWLVNLIIARAKRRPLASIYVDGELYMERWWLVKPDGVKPEWEQMRGGRFKDWGVRVHRILRSDLDRELHDHPWPNVSIVLRGGYAEILPTDPGQAAKWDNAHFISKWRSPGSVVRRKSGDRHRIYIPEGQEAWTIFITGPWERDWGFYTRTGWQYWRDFLKERGRS